MVSPFFNPLHEINSCIFSTWGHDSTITYIHTLYVYTSSVKVIDRYESVWINEMSFDLERLASGQVTVGL